MGYRYILIVKGAAHRDPNVEARVQACLRTASLEERSAGSEFRLLVSQETPTIRLRGGGVIIGQLFTREGIPVREPEDLPELESPQRFRRHLLDHCWGDYVLAIPGSHHDEGPSFLRDPSGGIPCLYAFQGRAGLLTSDVSLARTLGLHELRIDWETIERYLIFPFYKAGRTGWASTHELLPGCSLHFNGATSSTEQEWKPWDFIARDQRHVDAWEAAKDVHQSVTTAVRAWAATDARLLLELSGGLDSSIVGTCLQDTAARVACCTMMTPVPGSDERGYAKRISDRLGTALHTEWLGFEHMQFDFAPPSDSVAPRVGPLQHAVEQVMQGAADRLGANAHISGAGGDTVFCYLRTAAPATDAIRAAGLWRGLTTIWDLSQLHQCTVWKAGRLALRKLLRPPTAPYVKEHAFLSSKVRTDVEAHPWYAVPTEVLPGDRERIFELAGSQVFRESTVRGHARPVRMPLLSQPVMESCLRVPTWMWVTGGHNRAVARSAFAERLPPELLHRRSKGSLMNFLGATYGRTKHSVGDFLLSGELTSRGLLDADSLRQFIGRELLPREETFTRLYDLCMIENWVRHNA